MTARKPAPAHEVLICLAHSVVVHIGLPRERTYAGKLFANSKLACRDEVHDLLSELLSKRDLAFLTQHDLHLAYLIKPTV
jgi:hypothetical protein